MGVVSLGRGGSWNLDRSTEKGPVTTGVGLGGGASACSTAGTGDGDLESFVSVDVAEGGGACLDKKKKAIKN